MLQGGFQDGFQDGCQHLNVFGSAEIIFGTLNIEKLYLTSSKWQI
jgi:hypothetical protein